MVSAVRAAYPRLSHRYYALKARWFGKERLMYWDRNAPLPDVARRKNTAGRRRARPCSTPMPASRRACRRSRKNSSTGAWIDAPVRPGKAPGAFAHPTSPRVHPYVLLNYQGKPRDVMTLAHELGHGVHQVLAAPQWPADGPDAADARRNRLGVRGNAHLPRPAGGRPRDPTERRAMLASKVEDMLNTVVRQIAFYSFERKLHLERQQRRTHRRADLRSLDERAGRKPGAGDRIRSGL